jgi:mannose-6-phosphate isomerase-like protein (cupin superfamily)
MPDTRSIRTAPHYRWGDGCDGFILVDTDNLLVIEEIVPPGSGETRHLHERARQFFYILDGRAVMTLEGGDVSLNAGDGVEITPGTPHRFWNPFELPVRFLVSSAPSSRGDRVEVPEPRLERASSRFPPTPRDNGEADRD